VRALGFRAVFVGDAVVFPFGDAYYHLRRARPRPAVRPDGRGPTRGAPALLPETHRARVYRAQGWISPVLHVDGRMDGVWRHEKKGTRLSVTIEPFANLADATRRAAEAEAERLATFLGGALDLTWAV
jgi:hypothetical protein